MSRPQCPPFRGGRALDSSELGFPLVARNGHGDAVAPCPLLSDERIYLGRSLRSDDRSRTSRHAPSTSAVGSKREARCSARACQPSGHIGTGRKDKSHLARIREERVTHSCLDSCGDQREGALLFSSPKWHAPVPFLLACSFVGSRNRLAGSSASRLSLDGAVVFAGIWWRGGGLGCRAGPKHLTRRQGAAGAG
jgi:hypothetical protein